MEDKRPVVYPSLLFVILFFLITLTGYLQIRVTQKNIEGLLMSEGEILSKHVQREIDLSLEHLDLLDKSASLVTPNLLNLMAYDEAIIDNIFSAFHNLKDSNPDTLPFSNVVAINGEGKTVFRKGEMEVPRPYVKMLLSGKQETFVKLPGARDHFLLVGMRMNGNALFIILTANELTDLRKRMIIRGILEREEKGVNIVSINMYDPQNSPYLKGAEISEDTFRLYKPLDSRFLRGYSLEILISKGPALDLIRRTTISFSVMLLFLVVFGAISIYAIFLLQRRHSTKLAEMEKEMELKERLVSLGKLASGMAHEIRNPLNAISMSVQRLKREFTPENDVDEYYRFIDIMRAELLRVDRIVEEFLLSTKSRVPFLRENLYTIVEELVILTKEQARTRQITVHNDVDQGIFLECQKERLKQALYNLLLNGIEAIKGNGSIELSAETKGRGIEFSIKDSGTGIKKEHLHNIFEYYYTTKDKGMGLGLPISYMIVKDHGGDIKVSSEEGQGTTFVISMPVDHPQQPADTGDS
jgi:signal transduction histidine kinase